MPTPPVAPERTSYEDAIAFTRSRARTDEIDFVARVNTPWTQLGLEVWLERCRTRPHGVVLVVPSTLEERSPVPEATRAALTRHSEVTIIEVEPFGTHARYQQALRRRARGAPAALRAFAARGRPLALISPRRPDISLLADLAREVSVRRRQPQFHVLDEGFGGTPVLGWHSARVWVEERTQELVRAVADTHDHFLGTGYDARSELVSCYRAAIARHSGTGDIGRRTERPMALLITSYWARYGWMSEDDETRLFAESAQRLDRLGYAVRLKQHPRETPGRYDAILSTLSLVDFAILPQQVVAEAFLHVMDPARDIVVGLLSNAHFTGQVIYGLRSVLVRAADYHAGRAGLDAERLHAPILPMGSVNLSVLGPAGALR